jgi:hypothetical protein
MPEEKNSEPTARKKRAVRRPAAKKSRKRAVKASAAPAEAPAAKSSPPSVTGDRLSEVARTIGSTVGGIVAKTKKALRRDGETKQI